MIEEALAIVQGARDRYDGIPRPPIGRNPWNEIECGGHYARAMSSWSLLSGASGYEYDGRPSRSASRRGSRRAFQVVLLRPGRLGQLRQMQDGGRQRNEIHVVEGRLVVANSAWPRRPA